MMIEPTHKQIPVARQCDLLGLQRSTLYYRPRGENHGARWAKIYCSF